MASPHQPPLTLVRIEQLRQQPVLTSAEVAETMRVSLQRFLDSRERLYKAGFPQPLHNMGRRGMKWSGAAVFRYLDGAPAAEPQLGTAIASDADDDAAAERGRRRQQRAANIAKEGVAQGKAA